jgi:hypothetical protein
MAEQQQQDGAYKLVRALREKKPVPAIDFTLHKMDDGTEVSTQERVHKGELLVLPQCTLCCRRSRSELLIQLAPL